MHKNRQNLPKSVRALAPVFRLSVRVRRLASAFPCVASLPFLSLPGLGGVLLGARAGAWAGGCGYPCSSSYQSWILPQQPSRKWYVCALCCSSLGGGAGDRSCVGWMVGGAGVALMYVASAAPTFCKGVMPQISYMIFSWREYEVEPSHSVALVLRALMMRRPLNCFWFWLVGSLRNMPATSNDTLYDATTFLHVAELANLVLTMFS